MVHKYVGTRPPDTVHAALALTCSRSWPLTNLDPLLDPLPLFPPLVHHNQACITTAWVVVADPPLLISPHLSKSQRFPL